MFDNIEDNYMFILAMLATTIENLSHSQEMCAVFVIINRARLNALKKLAFSDIEDELNHMPQDFNKFMKKHGKIA